MKFKYDKQRGEWYTLESVAYANDDYSIRRLSKKDKWELSKHYSNIGFFHKLKNAKLVAKLLNEG